MCCNYNLDLHQLQTQYFNGKLKLQVVQSIQQHIENELDDHV